MTTRQARIVQNDWSSGTVQSVDPTLIPDNGATAIYDGLLNIDGTVYERGAPKTASSTYTYPALFLFDGLIGSARVRIVGTTGGFYRINDDGAVTLLSSDALRTPTNAVVFNGSLWIGGGHRYGAFDGWQTASPWSDCYGVVANRLVWKSDTNKFRFSEINNPSSFTNDLDSINEHTLQDGLEITGFSTIGQTLIVHTTTGAQIVQGMAYNLTDEAGQPLQKLLPYDPQLVLWGRSGAASWEGLVIVPSTNGVFLVDGTSAPVRISGNIDPIYLSYVGSDLPGGRVSGQATVDNNHYFLPILQADRCISVLVCRLDRSAADRRRRVGFPWSILTGAGANVGAYTTHVQAEGPPREPSLIGAQVGASPTLLDCSGYFDHADSNRNEPDGSPVKLRIESRDFVLNALGESVPRKARLTYELSGRVADDPAIVFDVSDGALSPTGPRWGDPAGIWGVGFGPATNTGGTLWPWTSYDSQFWQKTTDYSGATVSHGVSDGTKPEVWLLGGRRRRLLTRIRRLRASAGCVIHDLEIFHRPSGSVRRAR